MIELKATPDYARKRSGLCFVVGTAAAALQELERAISLCARPWSIIGVNRAVEVIDEAFAMVTADSLHRAPNVPGKEMHRFAHVGNEMTIQPGYHYIWRGPRSASIGSSSLPAALIARHGMGFGEVVLCGVPLDRSGHYPGYQPQGAQTDEFNNDGPARNGLLDTRRAKWRQFHADGSLQGVTSMSGFTRQLLGAPAWLS